jgi:hypothetical protein
MKLAPIFLALSAVSISASAATISPGLEARAAELRRHASPEILAWAHERGVALARAKAPVNLRALKQSIRSQIVVKGGPAANRANERDQVIEAMAFLVLMVAVDDSNGDLRLIMSQAKAMNSASKGVNASNLGLARLRQPGSTFGPPKSSYREACQSNRDCPEGTKCVQGACY